jgi:predicted RNA methylase
MIMQENGCGSTISAQDLINNPKVLYVGVGGGMELYNCLFLSSKGVVGVDVVDEMLEASRKNFLVAEEQNDW